MIGAPYHLLIDTITVRRPQTTIIDGSLRIVYTDIYTNIAARVQPRGGDESVSEGIRRGSFTAMVFLDPVYQIQSDDLVLWNSKTLRVIRTPIDVQDAELIGPIECQLIEGV